MGGYDSGSAFYTPAHSTHVASDINKVTTIIEYAELNGREKVKANKLYENTSVCVCDRVLFM